MIKQFFSLITFLFGVVIYIHAQESVPLYTKYEAQFKVDSENANPFFSNEIQVDAVIAHENGKQWIVPCFYDATLDWKMRFAPMLEGLHSYEITVQKDGTESTVLKGTFDAVASNSKGFIRVSKKNPRLFAFDNGDSYYPLGQNLCWVNPAQTSTWVSYLEECESAGINWIRIWMVSWGNTELVWTPRNGRYHGYERYDINNARMLDDIFAEAEKRGIYIELVINHHGQYSRQTNPIWNENPYNVANGGFLRHPQQFFTDETAKQHYRNRLRYLVGRYGYSTSLMAWEYWNEVDLTTGYDYETVSDWHREMSSYFDEIDPYKHLRSTSASSNFHGNYMTDGMHFIQSHNYRTNITGTVQSLANYAAENYPNYPHFHGELSYDYRGPNTEDKDGVILHNQLWSSVHSADAGTAMTWWWDNWVRPYNLYPKFRAVANYVEDIDWISENFQPIEAEVKPHPENVVDLNILPVVGWGPTRSEEFTVHRDGLIESIHDLSSFVHGSNHRNMSPNPTFIFLNDLPTQFGMEIQTIARAGSNLSIAVNDKTVLDHNFPSSSNDYTPDKKRFEVPLPAGPARVSIQNTGKDWINVQRYWIEDYAERIQTYAIGNSTKALVWLQDSTHKFAAIDEFDTENPPHPTEVTIPSLLNGKYKAEHFDTYKGTPILSQILLVSDNRLTFPVSVLNKDTAYRIELQTSTIEHSNRY